MSNQQQQFHDYIVNRSKDDKKDEVKSLLKENFEKQSKGEIDNSFLEKWNEKLLEHVKPEYIEDVTALLNGFASNF